MAGINRLSSGGLIVTYRCSASCGHCLFASSPKREGAYADADAMRGILRKLRRLGCRSLHIGGGEPFFSVDGLCAVLGIMREEGMEPDYLETNAYWATSPARAHELIGHVTEAHPVALMFSLCPYHAAYVPLDRVKNAVAAARALGVPYFLWQERFIGEVSALGDPRKTHSLHEYERAYPGGVDALPGRFGLRMLGRAALTHDAAAKTPLDALLDGSPCRSMIRTSHFHIDMNGFFIPPGCTGFAYPLDELDCIGGQAHPATALLLEGGVKALFERAVSLGFVPNERYIDKCGLCQHIRAFLALRHGGYRDLAPRGFYEELYPEMSEEQ